MGSCGGVYTGEVAHVRHFAGAIAAPSKAPDMAILRCATPAEAGSALESVQDRQGSALFLFFGSEDPATGQSWCPDCVTADPVLRRACSELRPGIPLHECPVGLRADWKNQPAHAYRLHPAFHLERIPTLVLIEGGCERGRLVEGDCADRERVKAFLGGA
ncbi:MAG: DUF953 domain-containing protein [Planctomycetes bacterium]|nr:DUF953 domain-containing protein [Planctomycetota bacterium]